MKKTILTVVCAALIAAFASGCATGLPGMSGANDQETAQTSDKNAYIEIIAETTVGQSDPGNADAGSDDDKTAVVSEESLTPDVTGRAGGYKDDELLTWAAKYYEFTSGAKAPKIEIDHVDGDLVHIHIFEDIEPAKEGESDPGHRTTLEWYIVDRKTGLGKNFAGEDVDLTSMFKRTMSGEEAAG